MRRFYTENIPEAIESSIELSSDIIRHLSTVLRQQQGSRFELFNGKGLVALCVLESDGKTARIEQVTHISPPRLHLELIQGLAKGEKLDMILQKGTELGLSRFVLTPTERTMVKITKEKEASRTERWQKIVHEACRQCGQTFAPEIKISNTLDTALNETQGALKLMLWEEASTPLQQLLPEIPPASICVLVGPEGGFSKAEANHAQAAGFQKVRLGPRILRTETAGLAILSILQYVYGDFDTNMSESSSRADGKDLS